MFPQIKKNTCSAKRVVQHEPTAQEGGDGQKRGLVLPGACGTAGWLGVGKSFKDIPCKRPQLLCQGAEEKACGLVLGALGVA